MKYLPPPQNCPTFSTIEYEKTSYRGKFKMVVDVCCSTIVANKCLPICEVTGILNQGYKCDIVSQNKLLDIGWLPFDSANKN